MTILATIIVLGVLIFVHELGHFLAARSVGIRVERFSIGLGPRVWGHRRGDTEYVLSAIPLGGYVKMAGMHDDVMERIEGGPSDRGQEAGAHAAASDGTGSAHTPTPEGRGDYEGRGRLRGGDFDAKPVWARAWVISAGVAMNMLFAFAAYTAVAVGWGSQVEDTTRFGRVEAELLPAGATALADIPSGAELVRVGDREVSHWGDVQEAFLEARPGPLTVVFADPGGEVTVEVPSAQEERERIAGALGPFLEPELALVQPGSPADEAGLQAGDRVVDVDGTEVTLWSEVQEMIRARPGQETRITIQRDGGRLVRTATPEAREVATPDGGTRTIGHIGVSADVPFTYSPVPPLEAVRAGWDQTVFVTGFILGFVRDLVTGQVSARNLGSIVTIGEASGQAAAAGIPAFLSFMALFSVNLAILNLLPIPVLDGGHLVFLSIEAVRGRPVSVEQRLRWTQVGFVILIGIMALALGNDFLRLFGL